MANITFQEYMKPEDADRISSAADELLESLNNLLPDHLLTQSIDTTYRKAYGHCFSFDVVQENHYWVNIMFESAHRRLEYCQQNGKVDCIPYCKADYKYMEAMWQASIRLNAITD
jgi:hypothetical protein